MLNDVLRALSNQTSFVNTSSRLADNALMCVQRGLLVSFKGGRPRLAVGGENMYLTSIVILCRLSDLVTQAHSLTSFYFRRVGRNIATQALLARASVAADETALLTQI